MAAAARAAPRARFLRIEHAGHAPFLGHADEVAAALLELAAQPGGAVAA
jgi:pimeloyl-[acyl-carrier protein] methyl ester esterase